MNGIVFSFWLFSDSGQKMNKASLKTLIRYKNYLQNFSTLYLQGAFFSTNYLFNSKYFGIMRILTF